MMSARVDRWIVEASKLGLNVKVEHYEGSRFVQIRMREISEDNMLAIINNSEVISIHEFKGLGNSSRVNVHKYGFLVSERKLIQQHVLYAIQGMAESYDRYWKIEAEKVVA